MQPEIVQQLSKLLPPEMHANAWIAGGYAHDPEKASDIDLWVVGQPDLEAAANAIRAFHGIDHPVEEINDPTYNEHPHGFRVALNQMIEWTDAPEPKEFSLEWYLTNQHFRKVQVLVTSQPTIDVLLAHFDITTHAIAYKLSEPATFKVGEGYFPIGSQPRVKRWDTPGQTLQRLEKICDRYGFEPHPEDVEKLEQLAAKAADVDEFGWEEAA